MPNLGEHGCEKITDTLLSIGIYERFILALDVLWVGGSENDPAWDTVCEFRDSSFHKAVDVDRNGSNRNCFVTAWKLSGEASTRGAVSLTCLCLA